MDFLFVYLFLLLLLASDNISFSHSSNSSKEFKSVVCVALLATFIQKKNRFLGLTKKLSVRVRPMGELQTKLISGVCFCVSKVHPHMPCICLLLNAHISSLSVRACLRVCSFLAVVVAAECYLFEPKITSQECFVSSVAM